MRAELLRERVTIQAGESSKGAAGGRVMTWSDVTTVWARVKPVSAADKEEQGLERESRRYSVTLRYREGIKATTNRLSWKGTLLDILSVVADERRTQVTLECIAGTGGSGPA